MGALDNLILWLWDNYNFDFKEEVSFLNIQKLVHGLLISKLFDDVTNSTLAYNAEQVKQLGINVDFEVIGSPSDTSPPVINSVELSDYYI